MAKRSHGLFLLLIYWIGVTQAVTFQRVCQATNPYAPTMNDCKGFDTAVKKYYPKGTIVQTNFNAECLTVFKNNTCRMDVCAFPNQGINVTDFITTASNIISNCQATQLKTSPPQTGGYDIILNTNVTVGVLGTSTPYAIRCTTNQYTSPTLSDCFNAIDNLRSRINVTQSSSTGCTTVSQNGTCSLYYCDAQGAQMHGAEYKRYLNGLFYGCASNANGRTSGWIQIDDNKRVGLFSNTTGRHLVSGSAKPTCQQFPDVGGPSQSLLPAAISAIQKKFPSTITQSQANSECSKIYVNGNLQIDLCTTTVGQTLNTSQVISALQQVNQSCSTGTSTPSIGGYVNINGTLSAIVSLSASGIARNIWCNSAPNNSPKSSDCSALLSSINTTSLYGTNSPNPTCTVLGKSGTCKLNVCAAPWTVLSGQTLYNAMSSITSSCQSGNYVSGIYRVSTNTSIAVFDPPSDTQGGIIYTDNSAAAYSGGERRRKREDAPGGDGDEYGEAICDINIENLFGCNGVVDPGFGSDGAVSGTCYTFGSTNCFDSFEVSGCGDGVGIGICNKPNDSNFYTVFRNKEGPSTLTCTRGDGNGPTFTCGNPQVGRDICNESPCSCT